MRLNFRRSNLLVSTASAILLALGVETTAQAADPTYHFDIPAETLSQALMDFSQVASQQIIYSEELVKGRKTPGLRGRFTSTQALSALLAGTDLKIETNSAGVLMVRSKNVRAASNDEAALPKDATDGARMRLAQATESETKKGSISPSEESGTARAQSRDPATQVQEIVVTAQKREERLQDVPVPVTAINAQTLLNTSQLRLQDYYSMVPGLSVTPTAGQQTQQLITIRGIQTGAGNPSVGITVDDAPYGSSTLLGGGIIVPDLDPSVLGHIEVLRGPQGTLYGASSMGGLIKFVTVDPSTDGLSGRLEAGGRAVNNGAELGYDVRGAINLPLSDTFAVRASAFTREDPGYIDNPILGIEGINHGKVYGGHLAGLWKPSDTFSVKLNALYQNFRGDGSSSVTVPTPGFPATTGLGDLQQNYILGSGANRREAQFYSATVKTKLGAVDLTAISSYNVNRFSDVFDFSYVLGPATLAVFGVSGAPLTNAGKTKKFNQEVRFSIPIDDNLEWLLGGFYTHEKSTYNFILNAEDTNNGRIVGQWLYQTVPSTYAEYAGFTDLTYRFTDRFDVQIGVRESHIDQTFSQTQTGPLVGPSPIVNPHVDTSANVFTYLVTPRFRISPDLMAYIRLASGYRPGGPNAGVNVPQAFRPDKTENYEIGVKGDVLDHRLSFDASLFYIAWKNLQVGLINSLGGYNGNAGAARSRGLELSAQGHPTTGLTVAAWATFTDAELTTSFPANSSTYGAAGDRLPYTSRFSGAASIQQDFPISGRVTGYVGAEISYVGSRLDIFTGSPQRQKLPHYTKTNLRAGARLDQWTGNFYVTNVFDKRGVLTGGFGSTPPFAFIYIQPRTIGFSIARMF